MSAPTVSTEKVDSARRESGRNVATALRSPRVGDGARIWRIAKDSRVLDVNSSYAYVLWCRDFAATSLVAEVEGRVVGFVIGYLRPDRPDTVFVWQVAVDRGQRGRGTGAALISGLMDAVAADGATTLETTIAPDNPASIGMFDAVARRRGAEMTRRPLFGPGAFPDDHAAEDLYRIAPKVQEELR
ncbi:diaminobutyrate acetyltransferase [Nocardia bovistercoris]|uniref:L-2,4-diaminobutyric acid acetyltransferase n=1 Tax=Nocardia bovistercoris TaxID=2785916 RepID=A0A931IEU8_9NOCA|nr:diaminobutyrate acetyltransferase [Nocardia bovistercoris]MBH0780402.1 diaminobutyrate acetyltransferase [Nocardia bovistercoris]